jgi:hypothetical protein
MFRTNSSARGAFTVSCGSGPRTSPEPVFVGSKMSTRARHTAGSKISNPCGSSQIRLSFHILGLSDSKNSTPGPSGYALDTNVQQVNAFVLDGSGNIWLDTSSSLTKQPHQTRRRRAPAVTPTVTAVVISIGTKPNRKRKKDLVCSIGQLLGKNKGWPPFEIRKRLIIRNENPNSWTRIRTKPSKAFRGFLGYPKLNFQVIARSHIRI